MTEFGSKVGMPKTVVIGTRWHTIYFESEDTVSENGLRSAIAKAQLSSTGISNTGGNDATLKVYPNPTVGSATIETLLKPGSNSIAIIRSVTGVEMKRVYLGANASNLYSIDLQDLSAGLYLLEINSQILRIAVTR